MDYIPRFRVVESGDRLSVGRVPWVALMHKLGVVAIPLGVLYVAVEVIRIAWLFATFADGAAGAGTILAAVLVVALVAAAPWGWRWVRGRLRTIEQDHWLFDRKADEVRHGPNVVCAISAIDAVTVVRGTSSRERRSYRLVLNVAGLKEARRGARTLDSAFDTDIRILSSPVVSEVGSHADRIAAFTGARRDET